MEQVRSGILRKSIASGAWLSIGYVLDRVIGLVSFFILARLLTPKDFGTMAIVLLIPKFLQGLTDPGFGTTIVQKDGDVTPYLNPMWTIQVLRAAAIGIATYAAAPFIASFFHAENLILPIRLGGLFMIIQNLSTPGEIFFFRELNFKKVFIRNSAKQAAYVIVATLTALAYPTYWALMAGTLALYGTEALSTYILHPYRPWFSFQFARLKELLGYSKWVFGQGLLDQTYSLVESATVGRVAGISSIGLYTKAKSVSAVVPGFLTSIINLVSFPAYARLKESPEKIRDGFLKSMDLIAFLVMPIATLLIAGGGKLIQIALGAQWIGMTNPLRVLLIYYAMSSVVDISYRLFSGIGYPDKKVKLDLVRGGVTITLIIILTPLYGITGTAFALLSGLLPVFALNLRVLSSLTATRARDIFATLGIPLFVSLAVIAPFLTMKDALLALPMFQLFAMFSAAGVLYIAILAALNKLWRIGPYNTLKIIVRTLRAPTTL
jgi:O-antigen/teichoic acid export membrane protein